MNIKLITFDLDNTLWESHQVLMRATAKTNAWINEHVPEYSGLDSDAQDGIRAAIVREQPEITHDVSLYRLAFMKRSFQAAGIEDTRAERLSSEAFDVFMHWRCQVEPYPEAIRLLANLSRSYSLASITNGNSDITQTSIDRYFDFHVNAVNAGCVKPDVQIFRYTLERAGISDPAKAIHIGDSFEDDVKGARAAGMNAIWLDHAQSPTQVLATATVQDLTQLEDAVRAIDEAAK